MYMYMYISLPCPFSHVYTSYTTCCGDWASLVVGHLWWLSTLTLGSPVIRLVTLPCWGKPERVPPMDPQRLCCLSHTFCNLYIRPTGYRIFLLRASFSPSPLDISRDTTCTCMCTLGSHSKVQSSSSWSCSLTSLFETDRDTEVSHHSLRLLLLFSVE